MSSLHCTSPHSAGNLIPFGRCTVPIEISFLRKINVEYLSSYFTSQFQYEMSLHWHPQKTHSASIISGPNTYEVQEKKTGQKIIEMDCRGLEFVEFKPDVSVYIRRAEAISIFLHLFRASGRLRALSLLLHFLELIFLRVNGMITTRSPMRRSVSKNLTGLLVGHKPIRYGADCTVRINLGR